MARFTLRDTNFAPGLNTKASPAGLPFGYFTDFSNVRVNNKVIARRKGMKRLLAGYCGGTAVSFAATTDTTNESYGRFPLNTSIHKLPTQFTIDIVVNPAPITAGTGSCAYAYILGFESGPQPFSLFLMATADGSGNEVYQFVFRLIDENAVEWLLVSQDAFDLSQPDAVFPIRIVRDGSHMEMRIPTEVENTVQCSIDCLSEDVPCITPTDDLILGSLPNSSATDEMLLDFIVDEFRIFHSALPGFQHCFTSFPDTRYPSLVAYYRFDDQDTGTAASPLLWDDSRYGNHGIIIGSASFVSPGLVQDLPTVEGLVHYRNSDGSRKLVYGAGDFLYTSKII